MPKFDELPFKDRPDLSPFLIHFTKNSESDNGLTAFDNLCLILETGKVRGSGSSKGFVKGPNEASCFMDVPFMSLKYVFTKDNVKPERPRYEPYGVLVTKRYAYNKGARPVLYLSDNETLRLCIPGSELWRVVKLETDKNGNWISWLHEREWRKKGDFSLPRTSLAALVKTATESEKLAELIRNKNYTCSPRSVIPLKIVCQGLTLM